MKLYKESEVFFQKSQIKVAAAIFTEVEVKEANHHFLKVKMNK